MLPDLPFWLFLFRASNYHIFDQRDLTEFYFKAFRSEIRFQTYPGLSLPWLFCFAQDHKEIYRVVKCMCRTLLLLEWRFAYGPYFPIEHSKNVCVICIPISRLFFLGGGHQPSNQTQNLQEKLSRSLSREIALTHPAALSFLRSKVLPEPLIP